MTEFEPGGGLLYEGTPHCLGLIGRHGVLDVAVTKTVEVGLLLFKIGCQR